VRIAPGREDDGSFAQYRTVGSVCEHCNTNRRRNDVFVLEHENGERKVVGRNCLADFLRCEDADDFARYAEYADLVRQYAGDGIGDEEGYYGGSGKGPIVTIVDYLTVVRALIRQYGWVSRTAAKDNPDKLATASDACTYFCNNHPSVREWRDHVKASLRTEDEVEAVEAIEWARNVDDSRSEYLHTIKLIAGNEIVDFNKLDGYTASIIVAYRKACEREIERAEKAKTAKNKVWYGEAKKRYRNVKVVCKGLNSFEGMYGVTTLVRFEHDLGNNECAVLVWFASGDKYDDWEVDAEYNVDFTVKGHDDHEKYGKQTKINRVK
jgi:hypothetical protein